MTALVVDASVWVGAADASDTFSVSSRGFLAELAARSLAIDMPALARVEVACALARRLRDGERARQLTEVMLRSPLITLHAMDAALVDTAVVEGTRASLRAADAVYAALAARIGGTIVTWDEDLVRRAGGVTPIAWLEENR
ncbi:MAG: PIN domain-containing protein [Burkholderiales bacterium]